MRTLASRGRPPLPLDAVPRNLDRPRHWASKPSPHLVRDEAILTISCRNEAEKWGGRDGRPRGRVPTRSAGCAPKLPPLQTKQGCANDSPLWLLRSASSAFRDRPRGKNPLV